MQTLDYETLTYIYENTPGLALDKLKAVLEESWEVISAAETKRGVVFAYDEAQNLTDHAEQSHYPLALLLDAFQSIQKKGIPFMLILAGLPTLFPKLVQSRTFSERMFRVLSLNRLTDDESRDAIKKPIADANCPVKLSEHWVNTIVEMSGGYPYFIQFICKKVYDVAIQKKSQGEPLSIPVKEIEQTLMLTSSPGAGRGRPAVSANCSQPLPIWKTLSRNSVSRTLSVLRNLSRNHSAAAMPIRCSAL